MLAPIVVFVYNRVEHVMELINSLAKNTLCKKSDLIFFSDGNKNETDAEDVRAVREYINSIHATKIFKSVTIHESTINKGLARSVIEGISAVLKEYEKVIVLEDDLIVAEHFLKFMNETLDYYQDEKRIWSVSGFSRDIDYFEKVEEDLYFSVRAQSWSWGTWRDRWELMDWEIRDYHHFKWNFEQRRAFNAGGDDMASMLDRQQAGKINSWAIRFCYGQYRHDAYTVQPTQTLVQNRGQDGSGTNCNYVREYAELSDKSSWRIRDFCEDKEINAELKRTRKHIPKWKLVGSFILFVMLKGKNKI